VAQRSSPSRYASGLAITVCIVASQTLEGDGVRGRTLDDDASDDERGPVEGLPGCERVSRLTAVEQTWNIQASQGQIMALT